MIVQSPKLTHTKRMIRNWGKQRIQSSFLYCHQVAGDLWNQCSPLHNYQLAACKHYNMWYSCYIKQICFSLLQKGSQSPPGCLRSSAGHQWRCSATDRPSSPSPPESSPHKPPARAGRQPVIAGASGHHTESPLGTYIWLREDGWSEWGDFQEISECSHSCC